MTRIEDYALLGDLQTAALVSARIDRLVLLSAVRFRRLLCRAAGRTGARALELAPAGEVGAPTPLPERHADPGDIHETAEGDGPGHRLHAASR